MHSTTEQTHRIVQQINEALKSKQYCSAAFLGITQTFDKVWHTGLLYRLSLSLNYFTILKSYLQNRHFFVKIENKYTAPFPIHAVIPGDSVLGPLLYLLFTADLPASSETSATFTDDTAVLAIDNNPATASSKLQSSVLAIYNWLTKW
jgi:hypothetical protein